MSASNATRRPALAIPKAAAVCGLSEVYGELYDLPKRTRAERAHSPFLGAPGKRLTDHQRAFLATVAALTEELGRAPSAALVAEHTGLTRLGARRMLMALEAHGLIADVPQVVRSGRWALTEQGVSLLGEKG